MRHAVLLLAVLASCKTSEKKAGTPAGAPAAASCDYVSETVGTNHSCQEVYADGQTAALEAWCTKLQGSRDRGTFAKGKGCATEGRDGGCLYPNGSVNWRYTGDVSCVGGQEFKGAPKRKTSTPYRCASERLCRETQSVYDLEKTVEKKNCETAGSTFTAGSCSTENVIARCNVNGHTEDAVWVFYAPLTIEEARSTCTQVEGTFVEAASPSAGSGETGSAAASGAMGSGSGATGSAMGSAAGSAAVGSAR